MPRLERGHRLGQFAFTKSTLSGLHALRTLEAFQFVEEHGEVCPANWSKGDAGMAPTLDGVKATIG